MAFGDETVDGGGDGFGGAGEGVGISVEKEDVEAVCGGELSDSGTHLTASDDSDGLGGVRHGCGCEITFGCALVFVYAF